MNKYMTLIFNINAYMLMLLNGFKIIKFITYYK